MEVRRWGYNPFDTRLGKPNYIHTLCIDQDVDTLRSILQGDNTGVNSRDHKDQTPLHIVAVTADQPVLAILLQLLIAHGADLNAKEHVGGNTALHLTILYAKEKSAELVVAILLKKGALPAPINMVGRTPFDYALANGYRDIAQLIANVEEDPDFVKTFDPFKWKGDTELSPELLLRHIEWGNIESAVQVMQRLPKEFLKNMTPLHEAVSKAPRKETMIASLLRGGANPQQKDFNEDNAINYAIKHLAHSPEMLRVIHTLLEGGVLPHSANKHGKDAYELATEFQYEDVQELLQTGKIPMPKPKAETPGRQTNNNQQQSSLARGTDKGKKTEIKFKEPQPVKNDDNNNNNNTQKNIVTSNPNTFTGSYHPLHELVLQKGKSSNTIAAEINALFKKSPGLDPNLRTNDNTNDTLLHIAVRREKTDCVTCLLAHGARVYVKNNLGETPIGLSRVGPFGHNRQIEDTLLKANRVQIAENRWKRSEQGVATINTIQNRPQR